MHGFENCRLSLLKTPPWLDPETGQGLSQQPHEKVHITRMSPVSLLYDVYAFTV